MESQKNIKKYNCELCNYSCCKKTDYNKHLFTSKHLNNYNYLHENLKKSPKLYLCSACNKSYKFRQSLYTHKKKCNSTKEEQNITFTIEEDQGKKDNELSSILMELVKSNADLQKQMLELCKNSNTVINSNSHNKTFNLQVFLNEECKDAMNMSDFIKSIVLQTSNLLDMGELGYVDGISKIILKEMNEIAVNKRPIHCSDAKREILYIKEKNKWEKEGPDNLNLINAIREIEQKNIAVLMDEWVPDHPDHKNGDSSVNNEYMKLVKEATNGSKENLIKVIKRISKEVLIKKEHHRH